MRKSYIFESSDNPTAQLIVTEDPRPNLVRFEIWREGNSTALHLTKETVEELKDIFSTWGGHIRWADPPEVEDLTDPDDISSSEVFGGGS